MPPKKKQAAGPVDASAQPAPAKAVGISSLLEVFEADDSQTAGPSQTKADAPPATTKAPRRKSDANAESPKRRRTKPKERVVEEPYVPGPDDVNKSYTQLT